MIKNCVPVPAAALAQRDATPSPTPENASEGKDGHRGSKRRRGQDATWSPPLDQSRHQTPQIFEPVLEQGPHSLTPWTRRRVQLQERRVSRQSSFARTSPPPPRRGES
jgi:hypothetical protein